MRIATGLLALLAACNCDGDDRPASDAAPACAAPAPRTGEATYYDADGTGACSFDASPDRMVAALNRADYAGSARCGACLAVDGPDGSVTVRVVDSCPGCEPGDVDLSREAFARIAPLEAGRVAITWREVPCAVDGPLRYRFKDGSNAWWTAIQVRNHRHAIATLETRRAGGAWRALPRQTYNYFVDAEGLGDGGFELRVTDVHGHVLEDGAAGFAESTELAGAAQLAECP